VIRLRYACDFADCPNEAVVRIEPIEKCEYDPRYPPTNQAPSGQTLAQQYAGQQATYRPKFVEVCRDHIVWYVETASETVAS
jgi:hypothetical protein